MGGGSINRVRFLLILVIKFRHFIVDFAHTTARANNRYMMWNNKIVIIVVLLCCLRCGNAASSTEAKAPVDDDGTGRRLICRSLQSTLVVLQKNASLHFFLCFMKN